MAWLDIFIKPVSDVSDEPSDTLEVLQGKGLSDVSDVSKVLSDSREASSSKDLSDLSDVSDDFSITQEVSEAQNAFDRLKWCMDAYRAEGLRLHFYAVGERIEFTMVYPRAFTPSERAMVEGCFFKCLGLIAEHALELATFDCDVEVLQ